MPANSRWDLIRRLRVNCVYVSVMISTWRIKKHKPSRAALWTEHFYPLHYLWRHNWYRVTIKVCIEAIHPLTRNARSGVVCCTYKRWKLTFCCSILFVSLNANIKRRLLLLSALVVELSPYAVANGQNCSTSCCRYFGFQLCIPVNKKTIKVGKVCTFILLCYLLSFSLSSFLVFS